MQLKVTTEYAIRTMLFLARVGRVATSAEIAEATEIPLGYFVNFIRDMRKGGLVAAFPGANGGYALSGHPEEITLYDVVMVMERTVCFNRYGESGDPCLHRMTQPCKVCRIFADIQQTFIHALKRYTIAQIIREHERKQGKYDTRHLAALNQCENQEGAQ